MDQRFDVAGKDAGLLIFFARIDLDQQLGTSAQGLRFLGNRAHQFGPINGMDHVEQGQSVFGFVGLQGANQVQFHLWPVGAQVGVFALTFLHSVFPENHLTGSQGFNHRLLGLGFGNGNQVYRVTGPPGTLSVAIDLLVHGTEVFGDQRHGLDQPFAANGKEALLPRALER